MMDCGLRKKRQLVLHIIGAIHSNPAQPSSILTNIFTFFQQLENLQSIGPVTCSKFSSDVFSRTKYEENISSATYSQQISVKNSEFKNKKLL